MGKYCFLFKARIWDTLQDTESIEHGIIYANTFKEAMEIIEDNYGDDLGSVQLECYDCGLVTFTEDIYNKIRSNL